MEKIEEIKPERPEIMDIYLHDIDRREWLRFRALIPRHISLGKAVSKLFRGVNSGEIVVKFDERD